MGQRDTRVNDAGHFAICGLCLLFRSVGVMRPFFIRLAYKTGIVIAEIASDFLTEPVGPFESLGFAGQFDLGHNQPFVFTGKFVNFPKMSLAIIMPACFFDQRLQAKVVQQALCVIEGQGISSGFPCRKASLECLDVVFPPGRYLSGPLC